MAFSLPHVWIPPSDRPSHGIFCPAGHSWVAPTSSLICPSYSGLTQSIPAERISVVFFKIFVNLEDTHYQHRESMTSKYVLDKECEGCMVEKKPFNLFMSSNLSPSCLEHKKILLQLGNMAYIWGWPFFIFMLFIFSLSVVLSKHVLTPKFVSAWMKSCWTFRCRKI